MKASALYIPNDELMKIEEEITALSIEREKLGTQRHALQLELTSNHVPKLRRDDHYNRWHARLMTDMNYLQEQKSAVVAKLHELNLRKLQLKAKLVKNNAGHGNAKLDEFDLRNALSEPQRLLQLSYAAIQRLTRHIGTTDSDRSLMDCLKDYLERHGMLV